MTFRCDISANMRLQSALDAVTDMKYAIAVLREISLQKVESAGRAKIACNQLSVAASMLDESVSEALSGLCQCAEVQVALSPERWSDMTFDSQGHCGSCEQFCDNGGVPYSRMKNGLKAWRPPAKEAGA